MSSASAEAKPVLPVNVMDEMVRRRSGVPGGVQPAQQQLQQQQPPLQAAPEATSTAGDGADPLSGSRSGAGSSSSSSSSPSSDSDASSAPAKPSAVAESGAAPRLETLSVSGLGSATITSFGAATPASDAGNAAAAGTGEEEEREEAPHEVVDLDDASTTLLRSEEPKMEYFQVVAAPKPGVCGSIFNCWFGGGVDD